MTIDGYNLSEYAEVPLFTLLELAANERDFRKRKALFDLSNQILENTYMEAVINNEKNGYV